MFPIADRTAGPNELIFFEGTHRYPGTNIGQKNSKICIFQKSIFLIPRATSGPSAGIIYNMMYRHNTLILSVFINFPIYIIQINASIPKSNHHINN